MSPTPTIKRPKKFFQAGAYLIPRDIRSPTRAKDEMFIDIIEAKDQPTADEKFLGFLRYNRPDHIVASHALREIPEDVQKSIIRSAPPDLQETKPRRQEDDADADDPVDGDSIAVRRRADRLTDKDYRRFGREPEFEHHIDADIIKLIGQQGGRLSDTETWSLLCATGSFIPFQRVHEAAVRLKADGSIKIREKRPERPGQQKGIITFSLTERGGKRVLALLRKAAAAAPAASEPAETAAQSEATA
jgi:hypothetical protein